MKHQSQAWASPRRGAVVVAAVAALMMSFPQHARAQDTAPSGPTLSGIAWNCSGWYTVVSGDSCYSVEQAYNITAAEFLAWNTAVSSDCATDFWAGYSYCVRVGAPDPTLNGIASNCDAWHTVVSGDSCYSLEQTYNITAAEFLEWNSAVSSDCSTNFWAGYSYCVGVDQDYAPTSSISSSLSSPTSSKRTSSGSVSASASTSQPSASLNTTATTVTPYSTRYPVTSFNLTAPYTATSLPPQHTLSGQPSYCNTWHQVAGGETCQTLINLYSNRLTLDQLLSYNPTIGTDCTGLYAGWYVCVGIQSQNSTSVGWYTTQTNFTAPATTTYPGYVATEVANFTASPQQTGIPSTCQNFYLAQANDTCTTVLAEIDYITEDQFFRWNPALDGNCQGLWAGYYYCVANFLNGTDLPLPATVTASATPTAAGIVSTCEKWYQTTPDDDCDSIASAFGTFSADDFISWNPIVGTACDSIEEDTYYCVGIPGTPTTRSVIVTPTVAPLLPTQTGVVGNCTQFWLVSSSDTCDTIIDQSAVDSAADFYSWNPAVGANCTGLASDYYVCVRTSVWTTIAPISTVTIQSG